MPAEIDTAPGFEAYDAAIDWFRARVPLSDSDARELSARARERAFWAAGAATAAQAEAVQSALATAMRDGTSPDQWQKLGRKVLTSSSARHLEVVFRTNTQASYSAARQSQMYAPAVLRRRPWGLIQTVNDSRRSKICNGFDGTLMPLDDPGWLTRTPPFHHQCRTVIRNLTDAQAIARGGPTGWPSTQPAKGFGRAAAMAGPAQVAEADAELVEILENRRVTETVAPLETSPEVNITSKPEVANAIRKLGIDRQLRSPEAVKRLIGVSREAFPPNGVAVSATEDGSLQLYAQNDRVMVSRTVKPDGTVSHDLLIVAESLRGQGVAKALLREAANEYARAGLKRVTLDAADDGAYVWPKLGFTAQDPAVETAQIARFDKWLTAAGKPASGAKTMTDVANHADGEAWLKEHAPVIAYEISVPDLQARMNQ